MTYIEFKDGVEELGLDYTLHNNGVIQVCLKGNHDIIVLISTGVRYSFNIISDFILSDNTKDKLLDLCCELTRTPLEKRGCLI